MQLTRFFFFNDTATTEIYTLSLHDALPISEPAGGAAGTVLYSVRWDEQGRLDWVRPLENTLSEAAEARIQALVRLNARRSEEHTSELQSRQYLVCRLLLEKKKIPSS